MAALLWEGYSPPRFELMEIFLLKTRIMLYLDFYERNLSFNCPHSIGECLLPISNVGVNHNCCILTENFVFIY